MEDTLLIHNKSLRYRRASDKLLMELQEGDGLMAGSRHRANLLHRTFCGTRGNS
jgi:hypothetical protein